MDNGLIIGGMIGVAIGNAGIAYFLRDFTLLHSLGFGALAGLITGGLWLIYLAVR